jgi:hypothetical protein
LTDLQGAFLEVVGALEEIGVAVTFSELEVETILQQDFFLFIDPPK